MSKGLKFVLSLSSFLLICVCVGLFVHHNNTLSPQPPISVQRKEASISKDQPVKDEIKTVSVENSPTEKYILKYNQNTDTVYLITQKTDGTRIMSPVESINPFYLTDEDMKALAAGIELTSREDMYILIEDFSS